MTEKQTKALKLAQDLTEFAQRFEDGDWSEAINVTHQEIKLLKDAAQALAEQPAQQPYGWVRMNAGFNSGVFHLGIECPPGWVGGAVAVYAEQPAQQEFICSTGLCHYKAQQQEPVAHCEGGPEFCSVCHKELNPDPAIYPEEAYEMGLEKIAYYTSPPASKPWAGLTFGEFHNIFKNHKGIGDAMGAVEKKLREKNAQPSKPLTMQERTSIVRANKSFHDKNEIDAYGIIDDVEAAHGIKGDT